MESDDFFKIKKGNRNQRKIESKDGETKIKTNIISLKN